MQQRVMRLLIVLSIVCSASAWTFTWTNKDGKSYIEHSNDPEDCKQIEQAEGRKYRWVPEEDGYSIWLFENSNCEGHRAGYSPPTVWDHVSSRDLLSFRVAYGDDDTGGTSTSTTSTATSTTSTSSSTESSESTSTSADTTPTSTSTSTSTPSPSETPSNSDNSSTPAGAIAGGVVGGVAGVAAIGGLFFFLGRRRRANNNQLELRESGPDDNRPDIAATGAPSQPPAPSTPLTPMYGAAVNGSAPYDPTFLERKPELDSAPVYSVDNSVQQPVWDSDSKQAHSPFDDSATISHRPPARMMAELPGDDVMVEMSDSHRVNELEGDGGTPKKM
ncbi:hypothetical protein BJY01DRAFT_231117 [Aspergillus pseudoustus]|uniref:Mid2 domain-containing protein n=1 Tax=Aspergillus pseudoustus TaxID=1810923 RepID=A0ABR4KXR6_9EURO